VAGGDLSIRFTKRQQFSATFLESRTGVGSDKNDGTAEQVYYFFSDRKYGFGTQIEHYGNDFQMDTAFYNRTGFTSGWGYAELNFYPKNANTSVLKRVNLFTWNKYGRDQIQDGNERFSLIGVRFNFTRQFDSSQRRVLLDLLASYELVPGTVFHAGYGSLFEKTDFPEYITTSRGVFFKASYLHRF